jgi:hypothetical protein
MSYPQAQEAPPPRLHGLDVQEKTLDMIAYGLKALEQFPKTERYVLAAEMRQRMYAIYTGLITAQKKFHKKTILDQVDVDLAVLKGLVRLAGTKPLKYMATDKYRQWSDMLDEIGRMLGGLIKATK